MGQMKAAPLRIVNPMGGGLVEIAAAPLTLAVEVDWTGPEPGGGWVGEGRAAGLDFVVPPGPDGETEQVFRSVRIRIEPPAPGQASGAELSHVNTGTWASYGAKDFILLRIPADASTLATLARLRHTPARLSLTLTGHAARQDGTRGLRAVDNGEQPTTLLIARRFGYAAHVEGLPK